MIERALCPILVGREAELSELEDALLAALRGDGHVVLLGGEAGLGKTRLAGNLRQRAEEAGAAVLWGGCSEADLPLPYLPFLEAVGNYLGTADLEEVRGRLGPARRELAQLFPQLDPGSPTGDGGDAMQTKLRLFEAVIALLRIPADERGLLLVLEDIHWADPSTREMLDYMTRRLRGTRILVLATYRNDELHRRHPLRPVLQGWRRSGTARLVELQPLPAERIAEMVRAIFSTDEVSSEFRDFMHARSEGNPFVLEELLKAAIDRGDIYRTSQGWERRELSEVRLPETVRDTVLLRIERLTEEEAEILRAAAVLGASFDHRVLVEVSARGEDAVHRALETFVQHQLMEEDESAAHRYRFRHALTREAIYEDLIQPQRQRLHARAAETLRRLPGAPAIELAAHLVAADRWPDAVPVCLQAAAEAHAQGGFREASELYERVLPHLADEVERGKVLVRLGSELRDYGEPARAQPHLEEGIALLDRAGAERDAAAGRLHLGRVHWEQSRQDQARREYERAREMLEPHGPSSELARAYIRLASLHAFEFEFEPGLSLAQKGVAIAEAAGDDALRIWGSGFAALALVGLERLEEGFATFEQSRREAMERGLEWIAQNGLYNEIEMRVEYFRAREAPARIELLRSLRGYYRPGLMATLAEGFMFHALGEFERSRAAAQQALDVAREGGASTYAEWAERTLALSLAGLGRFDEARPLLRAPGSVQERQNVMGAAHSWLRIHLGAGEVDRALEHAPVALQVLEWPRPLTPASVALIDAAVEAYLAAGRLEEAERVVEGLRSAEVGQGQPYVQRSLGRLAAAQGRHDEAMELFRSVSDFFASVGYRDEEWRSRCLLAASLAALGERSAAGRELRAVLSGATRHGALFHARAAREALSALGLPADDGDEVEEVDEDGRTPAHERPAAVGAPAGPPTERLVTVLFADVRDYTAMTAALPPHEVAERIAALQRWAKHEIERHHGLVDKFAGDAVMATFNASSDRLDHARLALEAALAIRDKAALAGLAVGVGIATGGAIVGRLAEGANVSAIGETTNVAARLQAAAPGGTILLSEEAHRRVREWLRERAMEPEPRTLELKGFEHPVTAHALAASVSPTAPTRERRQRG